MGSLVLDVPFATYAGWDAINQSRLKMLKRSPAHCKVGFKDRNSTEAFAYGRAVHTLVLEPEVFAKQYAVIPKMRRGTKAYLQVVEGHEGKELLQQDDYEEIVLIADAIKGQEKVAPLLKDVMPEISIQWTDSATAIKCKARLDGYSKDTKTIIDIKTTADASPFGFGKSIATYGYHYQAAWYMQALRECGESPERFVFIAVEKTAPFAVKCYTVHPRLLTLAHAELQDLLKRYAYCTANDHWPAYGDAIEEAILPDYITEQLENNYGLAI